MANPVTQNKENSGIRKEAHDLSMAMTANHPELQKQVEDLATRGMTAEATGDYKTSSELLQQTLSLLDTADEAVVDGKRIPSAEDTTRLGALAGMLGLSAGSSDDDDSAADDNSNIDEEDDDEADDEASIITDTGSDTGAEQLTT